MRICGNKIQQTNETVNKTKLKLKQSKIVLEPKCKTMPNISSKKPVKKYTDEREYFHSVCEKVDRIISSCRKNDVPCVNPISAEDSVKRIFDVEMRITFVREREIFS